MGLVNLQTNLKSLKFGKDRLGGGDSGQPFIKKPIINEPSNFLSLGDDDFLLRGGVRAPLNAVEDVARLAKYMFNIKSPKGLLFIAKQNILSRVSPKTESSKGIGYGGGGLNSGVYTPLSTLAQAGVGFLGIHLNDKGIDPTGLISILSLNKYSDVIKNQSENRLVTLNTLINENRSESNFNFIKGYSLNVGDSVVQYRGGPGSILGIGKTKIRFAEYRTGDQNKLSKTDYFNKGGVRLHEFIEYFPSESNLGASKEKSTSLSSTFIKLNDTEIGLNDGKIIISPYQPKTKTDPGATSSSLGASLKQGLSDDEIGLDSNGKIVLSPYPTYGKPKNATITEDFRKSKINDQTKTFLSDSPDYTTKNIEQRVNLGDPGKRGDISNYTAGKNGTNEILDKITSSPIYSSSGDGDSSGDKNDLVKFRIGILGIGGGNRYVNFRAFIDKFSESYKASWKKQRYMGRGEEFYKYDGFGRDINIDFTVVAQSKAELIPMYKKLNFLASSLSPTYTSEGYMAGNLSKVTLGGYLYEQPGIIESLSYDIPDDSPWEIGIDNTDKVNDESVKELPKMIKVSMKFTPIHNFIPAYNPTGTGPERYIALSDGKNNNY